MKTRKEIQEWHDNYESPNTFEKAVKTTQTKKDAADRLFGREIEKREKDKFTKQGKKSHYLTRIDELLARLKSR